MPPHRGAVWKGRHPPSADKASCRRVSRPGDRRQPRCMANRRGPRPLAQVVRLEAPCRRSLVGALTAEGHTGAVAVSVIRVLSIDVVCLLTI